MHTSPKDHFPIKWLTLWNDWTITQHSVCALLGTKTMSGEEEVYHILQKYHLFFQCLCFMTAGQDGTYFGKQPVKT